MGTAGAKNNHSPLLLPWLLLSLSLALIMVARAEDPYLFFTWKVTYGTLSPLGTPEEVILINGKFPGPNLNTTTNNNVVVNVFNHLDEPLLFTWNGIQQRKKSWQDGTPGTMCPIQPGTNYTYHFQVKDQIGSFFYFPSTRFQKASGGFGGLRVNSRDLIPVPFPPPADDYTVLIGDWYKKSHKELRKILDSGVTLGPPDGLLINGLRGKVDSDSTDEKPHFTMKPGKTYRYRICNVGNKYSLNFRIQGHKMKLVEIEGSHTGQSKYDSLDIHLGQCYSVLVTANQKPMDYYMVVSNRFSKTILQTTGIIRYEGSLVAASKAMPAPPPEGRDAVSWSLNQFRSFNWNLTASAARPNPQGSYHYGQINITRTIKFVNSGGKVGGKQRFAINGVSHINPLTPLKLAEYFGVGHKLFKYNTIHDNPPPNVDHAKLLVQPNVFNATFRNFVEIIFENHENVIQSWHLNGYAFFPVAISPGVWKPDSRKGYNLLDAVSRYTIHVYPKSWAAILLTFDNCGMWNLRSEDTERSYLGQQLYFSVVSPERSLRDEYSMPDTTLLCGIVKGLPTPPPYH